MSRAAAGLLLGLLLLAGCAERWAKPGGTAQEFEATRTYCSAGAYQMFPPMPRLVPGSPGYFTPARQVCRNGRCWMQGGVWMPPTVNTVDDNAPGRNQQVRACLFAAGWQPVENEAQALVRADPKQKDKGGEAAKAALALLALRDKFGA